MGWPRDCIPNETAAKSSNNMHGYVLGQNAVLEDLQKLNWLPVIERRVLALLKISHEALYDDVWQRVHLHVICQNIGILAPSFQNTYLVFRPHHSFKHWNSGPLFINFGYLALVLQTRLEFWPYVYKHWNSGPIISNFEIEVLFI